MPGGSPSGNDAIKAAVRRKYAEVAVSAGGKFSYPTGREGATQLGYDSAVLKAAPEKILESFCGVGNPFSLGEIPEGSTVLDYGCGAGFDIFVASRLTGGKGRYCGVDLTREMADRARANLSSAAVANFEIRQIDSEEIPYESGTFDIVISNGVINLAPDKAACFREILRVLRPGGKLQFADVVLERQLPPELASSPEAWSQ